MQIQADDLFAALDRVTSLKTECQNLENEVLVL